jgi:hypothetical protein
MAERRSEKPRPRTRKKRAFVAAFEPGADAGGVGPAFLVPFDPEHAWGAAPRPVSSARGKAPVGHLVRATVNGHRFDGWIERRFARSYLPVDEAVQRAAGVRPGELAEVTVEPRRRRTASTGKRASSRSSR